jgi:DNA polymerase III subunit epsilon
MSVLDGPLVFVDIETNGLNYVRGRVVEVAAIRVERGQVVQEYRQLVDPGVPLPQFITNLTGITEQDLYGAPLFMAIAAELQEVLDGAVFVAHNVRFDYSFLKQEFKRIGKDFRPQQLCTVRLSRALFPEHRTHKLADLIRRHDLQVSARHRAYDDAHALWQFIQHVRGTVAPDVLEQAIAKQLKKPSLPKGLQPEAVATLPEGPGVYIMEDENGAPIYVGKSVNIKKRVASHFMRDHAEVGEFKLAQHVRGITARETGGELQALLLESQLVKQMQPLYNKQLRRTDKLLVARAIPNDAGYTTVQLEEVNAITIDDVPHILAVYPRRGRARDSLEAMAKDWNLCPKLLGLEKSKNACFQYQLHRCKGACIGAEPTAAYNSRLQSAFATVRIEHWPFKGAILVQEKSAANYGIVVDQWCVVAEVEQADEYSEPRLVARPRLFDLDAYKIIQSFLLRKSRALTIRPITLQTLQQQYGGM